MDDDPRRTAAMSKDFQRVRGEQTKAHKTYIKKANIGLLSGLSGPKEEGQTMAGTNEEIQVHLQIWRRWLSAKTKNGRVRRTEQNEKKMNTAR